MKRTWTVPAGMGRKRLDVFLAEQMPETTRSQIARLLKNGAGFVNQKAASVHEFVTHGDVIEFDDAPPKKTLPSSPRSSKPTAIPKLRIIDQTASWIVIDKPAGLLVHPDRHSTEPTLVDALVAFDPAIAKVGEDPSRPGIMHRLDKEASGLMVIARTQAAFDHLKKQFAEHKVQKRYLALVYGEMPPEGEIKFRIARSTSKQRMAARPAHEKDGKAAWTHFRTIQTFRHASLVELDIFSGRTHQIRTHLLAYNHPIMGDDLYKRPAEDRNISAPRLMLQSVHLEFLDPVDEKKRAYDLPPAPEFSQLIERLSRA